ncbi:MAG: hypothetical protein HUU50_11015 [Candidatus Brocadiae bacterium]|nr:hypothetical protein [Candidatus Brocadiia bacterium]
MNYVLTGRTGSGLSSAKRVFERNGFLISYPKLSNFDLPSYSMGKKHLLVIDISTAIGDNQDENQLVQYYQNFHAELKGKFEILFLDADESVLFRRQQQDQLPPLYSKLFNVPWMKAFGMEKKVLSPFYENARFTFNTSHSSPQELSQAIDLFINLGIERKHEVSFYSKLLSTLYYENFWANIGNRMSIFQEIAAQPDMVRKFIETFSDKIKKPLSQEKIAKQYQNASRIVITGMGSSYYVGKAVKDMFQKCYAVSLPLDCIPLSELSFGDLKNVLVVINSNSGETGEIKECFHRNLFKDAVGIIGITNYPESFLGKKCQTDNNLLFPLDVIKEKSISATVSVSANLLILGGILTILQTIENPRSMVEGNFLNDIQDLPQVLKGLLSQGMMNQIFSWTNKMASHFRAGTGFLVGCGAITSILPEAALKGIELARLHLSPLEHSFAHGPLNAGSLEGAIYLQDTLTSKEVVIKHIEKLIQHCPVFAVGPYWDLDLPNLHTLACAAGNPILNLFSHLTIMQLAYSVYGLIKGLSINEICQPSMLQKVVLSSPVS